MNLSIDTTLIIQSAQKQLPINKECRHFPFLSIVNSFTQLGTPALCPLLNSYVDGHGKLSQKWSFGIEPLGN